MTVKGYRASLGGDNHPQRSMSGNVPDATGVRGTTSLICGFRVVIPIPGARLRL